MRLSQYENVPTHLSMNRLTKSFRIQFQTFSANMSLQQLSNNSPAGCMWTDLMIPLTSWKLIKSETRSVWPGLAFMLTCKLNASYKRQERDKSINLKFDGLFTELLFCSGPSVVWLSRCRTDQLALSLELPNCPPGQNCYRSPAMLDIQSSGLTYWVVSPQILSQTNEIWLNILSPPHLSWE